MKQFPYAQQIIWENDVGQIEWTEPMSNSVWYSGDYIAKVLPYRATLSGWWRKIDDNTLFITDNSEYSADDLECWAKI